MENEERILILIGKAVAGTFTLEELSELMAYSAIDPSINTLIREELARRKMGLSIVLDI